MVSKEKRKFQKKKDKEKEKKKKVLARREELRKQSREERQNYRLTKRIKKIQKNLGDANEWSEEAYHQLDEGTLSQLEKNAEILKGLEMEYDQETAKKLELNQQLEEEGHLTIKDKLNAIQQDIAQQQAEAISGNGEGPVIDVNSGPAETSDVSIIRKPEKSEK